MSLKGQMTPRIFPEFHITVVVVHVRRRKKLKAVRGSYLPFVIKHALCPLRTMSLLVSCSGLWGVCIQTFVKHANFLPHHLGGMTLITSTNVSCFFDHFFYFLELKCDVTPCVRMHVSMSWDQYVWKFLLIYCTWN